MTFVFRETPNNGVTPQNMNELIVVVLDQDNEYKCTTKLCDVPVLFAPLVKANKRKANKNIKVQDCCTETSKTNP